jgi:hypothetical protein
VFLACASLPPTLAPGAITVEATAHEDEGYAKRKEVYKTIQITVTLRDDFSEPPKALSSIWRAEFPTIDPPSVARIDWMRKSYSGNEAPHEFALWPGQIKFPAGSPASGVIRFDLRTFTYLRDARTKEALRALNQNEFPKVDVIIRNFELIADQGPVRKVDEWEIPQVLADNTFATTALHRVTWQIIEKANDIWKQSNSSQRAILQELIEGWGESLRSRARKVAYNNAKVLTLVPPDEAQEAQKRIITSTRRFAEAAQVWNEIAVSYWLSPRVKRRGCSATDDKAYADPGLRKDRYARGVAELVQCLQLPEIKSELGRVFAEARSKLNADESRAVPHAVTALLDYSGPAIPLEILEDGLDAIRKCYSYVPEK